MCAAIGALELACGVDVEQSADASEVACTTVRAAGPWWNQTFPEQARRFHAEFDAIPSASSIDAVIGLGDGSASRFDQLAAIVRFNPSGMIDARAGSIYRADVAQHYQAGMSYHLRLDVEVRTHTYSVWLRDFFGGYTAIARNYPFRTEQAGVMRLNNVAAKVDSTTGTLQICGFQVVADATTADNCLIVTAGDGFVTTPLPDATVLDTLTFSATPSRPNIHAVIGLSAGPAARFSDLATAVRIAPNGFIDLRDGDVYRADVSRTYGSQALDFRMIADLTSHTYSVFEGGYFSARELARQYKFHTQQRAVPHLDHLSAIVDSPQGSVTICHPYSTPSTGVAYSREGNYAVAPLAGGRALVSDGATTWRLDAGGRIVTQVARGGELAADKLGNVFIASVTGNTLTVDKYNPSFVLRWRMTQTVLAGATIHAMTTDRGGAVVIGVVTPQEGRVTVSRFRAGAFASLLSVNGENVILDDDQAIVAWNDSNTLRITRFAATGATVWTRAFAGRAPITAMAVDPSHNVLFGGELFTPMDFGGGRLPTRWTPNGPINGFVVELSAIGAHVFSRRTEYTLVDGIASNGPRIVVSSTLRTQFYYLYLQSFSAAGTPAVDTHFNTGFGENGLGGRVWIGASGRVWWDITTQWPLFPRWPYFVVSAE